MFFLVFFFNFKGLIFGEVIPSPSSGGRPLPHSYFLATPLLPSGPADSEVRKFTGNGEIGTAHDHVTKAVHAFVHFSLLYSQRHILFCDLQGGLAPFFDMSHVQIIGFCIQVCSTKIVIGVFLIHRRIWHKFVQVPEYA